MTARPTYEIPITCANFVVRHRVISQLSIVMFERHRKSVFLGVCLHAIANKNENLSRQGVGATAL